MTKLCAHHSNQMSLETTCLLAPLELLLAKIILNLKKASMWVRKDDIAQLNAAKVINQSEQIYKEKAPSSL